MGKHRMTELGKKCALKDESRLEFHISATKGEKNVRKLFKTFILEMNEKRNGCTRFCTMDIRHN